MLNFITIILLLAPTEIPQASDARAKAVAQKNITLNKKAQELKSKVTEEIDKAINVGWMETWVDYEKSWYEQMKPTIDELKAKGYNIDNTEFTKHYYRLKIGW